MNKPELLAPAGSLEKAKTAFRYGADAVYMGTSNLSLRSRVTVDDDELIKTIEYAHSINKKVYAALNIYARDNMYEEIKKGFDVCYANFAHKKQKLWKNLGSYFNGKISQISIGKPKDIYLSPFKIITKDVVNEIIKFENLFPYIDGLIFQVTGNITQIDIEHHSREKGKSNYNLIKSIKVFLRMLFGFSTMPLNISTYSGFTCAFLGFVLGIIYLIQYFQGKADVKGWTTLVILLLFLGGLILVSLGIIGKYLGQIYLTVNRQPKFIIKEVINEK